MTETPFERCKLKVKDINYTLPGGIDKSAVLIIDDFGLAPLSDQQRRELLEVIEDRPAATSTVIVSQLPIDDAILDRFVHNVHKFNLHGESMIKRKPLRHRQKPASIFSATWTE